MKVIVVIIKTWTDHYTMSPSVKIFSSKEKAEYWVNNIGGPWTQWKEYEIEYDHQIDG